MDTPVAVGDEFRTYTLGLKRAFRVVEVKTIAGIAGKKKRKVKKEFKMENLSLDIHPAMTQETKERLRYFKMSEELLKSYIESGKWKRQ